MNLLFSVLLREIKLVVTFVSLRTAVRHTSPLIYRCSRRQNLPLVRLISVVVFELFDEKYDRHEALKIDQLYRMMAVVGVMYCLILCAQV